MSKRKPANKYYFSVEGETEQWYLKWLQILAACLVSDNLHTTDEKASFKTFKIYAQNESKYYILLLGHGLYIMKQC